MTNEEYEEFQKEYEAWSDEIAFRCHLKRIAAMDREAAGITQSKFELYQIPQEAVQINSEG